MWFTFHQTGFGPEWEEIKFAPNNTNCALLHGLHKRIRSISLSCKAERILLRCKLLHTEDMTLNRLRKNRIEAVIEMETKDCELSQALSGFDCAIDRISLGANATTHRMVCNDGGRVVMRRLARRKLKVHRAAGSLWVNTPNCPACSFFSSPFYTVLSARAVGNDTMQYRLLLHSIRDLRNLEARMATTSIHYNIKAIAPYARRELTERQRDILKIALDKGYFEQDSRTSLTKLAGMIGISPSSLSEILRRGLKKSVNFYFDHRE